MQYILHDFKKSCVFCVGGHLDAVFCQQNYIGLHYSGENDWDIYKDLQVSPFKRFHKISKHFKNTES